MKFWGLLGIAGVAAVDTYAAVSAGACANKVGCAGYYRAFAVSTTPPDSEFEPVSNVTGVSVAAVGFQAAGSSQGGAAKLDVAGFRFKTPEDNTDPSSKGLSFYWGYLGIGGIWNSAQAAGTMAGALAEVVASISSVNVYYDHDGVPGFQWNIDQADPTKRWDIYDCSKAAANNYDCVDTNAALNVANDLQWTYIDHTKVSCAAAPGLTTGNYAAGCEIHSLTTVGSLASAPTQPVLTFTIRIASQPVLINGVKHGPDFAKWEIQVNFPYSNYPNIIDAANARLAIVTVAAGKAGAWVGAASKSNGVEAVSWSAGGGVRAYYDYNTTATTGAGAGNTIYTEIITGAQINAFVCTAASPCNGILGVSGTNLLITGLKLAVTGALAIGWRTSIAIHAFGDLVAPATINWDPSVGAGDATNSALLAAPGALLLAALAMLTM